MTILGSLTSGLGLTGISQSTNTAVDQRTIDKLKEEYLKIQAQKAMQAQNSYGTIATNTTAINPYLTQQAYQAPIDIPKYNLEEGAWDVPISQLVDLWTVRFGSRWVQDTELDEFYRITTQRLRPLNKLESHYVNGHDVYRIVE
jgi:hypothetical protein